MDEYPALNIAIAHLEATAPDNYVVWVVKAPYPGGHVIENCPWTINLSQIWLGWQQFFGVGNQPYCLPCHQDLDLADLDLATVRWRYLTSIAIVQI